MQAGPQTRAGPPGPLAGLRVIEVSSFVAAPLGGMTLAQLGADVIRVDPIGGAADTQRWPPTRSRVSLYWAGLNKGKRSVTVDMRSEHGRAIVTDLVAACPAGTGVVLTNAVGRDWLSARALALVCPDLIHVQVEGRSDGAPAVDYTVNAEVGFPMVTGPAGHADPINHVLPAWTSPAACTQRSGSARPRGTGSSPAKATRFGSRWPTSRWRWSATSAFSPRPRSITSSGSASATTSTEASPATFICADGGRLMVVARTSRHWHDLLLMTDMVGPATALETSLGVDFSVEDNRFEYREVLAGLFQRWFAARPVDNACAALSATSLVWSRYRTFGEAVSHLQTSEGANPIVSVVDQPGVGPYMAPGSPLRFTSTAGRAEPAPRLGEHTESVLAELRGRAVDTNSNVLTPSVASIN